MMMQSCIWTAFHLLAYMRLRIVVKMSASNAIIAIESDDDPLSNGNPCVYIYSITESAVFFRFQSPISLYTLGNRLPNSIANMFPAAIGECE